MSAGIEKLGRFEIVRAIGHGGMGAVYEARDPDLARPVAIKLIPEPDAQRSMRLLREAQALAQVQHPNVVAVHEVGTDGARVYIAMELVDGASLDRHPGPRPWRDAVALFVQAGRGLAAAHAKGLVHRDVKPSNILLGADGRVRVGDFGLARLHEAADASPARPDDRRAAPGTTEVDTSEVDATAVGAPGVDTTHGTTDVALAHDRGGAVAAVTPRGGLLGATLTGVGARVGTPAYMAPEQLDGGTVGVAADQFSFCVALHEAIYGHRPFELASTAPAELTALRAAIRAGRVRPPATRRGVPRGLRAAILRGLRDAPAARWPSMTALVVELERHLHRPRRAALGVGLGLGLALTVATVVAWPRPRSSTAPAPAPAVVPAARWTERPLTFRGNLEAAALSPDGAQIAFFTKGEIAVVSTAGGEPRVVLRDVSSIPHISWSLDGRRLLVGWIRTRAGESVQLDYQLVDVATAVATPVGRRLGAWAQFAAADLIVSSSHPWKYVQLDALDRVTAPRQCALPGDYQWIWGVQVAGSAIYVRVSYPDRTVALLVTDTACSPMRVAVPPMVAAGFVPQADGRVFAFVDDDDHGQRLVELGRDGIPTGRELPVPLGTSEVVGAGHDDGVIVMRRTTSWRLLEPGPTGSKELTRGTAPLVLALSPDERRFALVEARRRQATALHVVERDHPGARPEPLATHVIGAAWSPDSTQLAAMIIDDQGPSLVTIDIATGRRQPLPSPEISSAGEVLWLDDRRVAYLRDDHRALRWIDRLDGTTGTLIDPTLGWIIGPTRSPATGALAVTWNRGVRGTWIVPSTGEPVLVRKVEGDDFPNYAWSADGRALWLFLKGGRIERYDVATGRTTHVRTIDLEPMTYLVAGFPLADGRLWLQTQTSTTDLVRYAER